MMKRLTALMLTLTLLLCMAAVPVASADGYATATVKGGWLRLRDGASTEAKTISAYFTGTTVTILGGSGEWYHVLAPDGKTGYMHSGYLTITGSITGGQLEENASAAVTSQNGKPVRLRSGPSVQYSIMATYPVGTPLTVLTVGDIWSKVQIGGRIGYMMNEYIRLGSGAGNTGSGSGVTAGSYTAYVVSHNGKTVVLRSGPSKQYEVLASYNVGQKVTVNSYGATWCQVTINGLDGYMMTEFLSTVKPETSEGSSGTYTAYVTSQNGKGVRLRSGAGKIFPAVATYSVGTPATVLEYGKSWCKVRINGSIGYMMTEFLTTKAPDMVTGVTLNATSVQVGDTLQVTVTPASATVAITWISDQGKTLGYGSSYTVKSGDVGRKIRASALGSGFTSGTAVSAWATVQASLISRVYQLKSVTISDTTPAAGQTLTVTLSPSGATADVTWYRDNGVIVGSGASYTVRAADVGYQLYAAAKGTGDTRGEVTSGFTAAVSSGAAQTVVLQSVTISDTTPSVGDTLTVRVAPANAAAAFTWRSSAGHVLGYGESYTVQASDAGSGIYVYANGVDGTSGSVVSALTSKVQQTAAATVRIDGVTLSDLTPAVGQVLYVTLSPANASAQYTWLRDDDQVLSTNSYYTVQADDVGHSIYVWAEGANGTFGSATSAITAPVKE